MPATTCSHARITLLEQTFAHIAATRMARVPVQNPALHVHAIGFEEEGSVQGAVLVGVLVTPWFMNLVRLPVIAEAQALSVASPTAKVHRTLGVDRYAFIGAHEDALGAFEACSLFSPMFEFDDHATAVATAQEILAILRQPVPQQPQSPTLPSRRGFLFGPKSTGAKA